MNARAPFAAFLSMKKLRTLLALGALVLSFTAWAQVPQLLSYQGRVTVGAVNFEGAGQFKFALVNAAGTTTFWSNDGTSTAGSAPAAAVALPVTKGLYSLLLGDTALPNMTAIPASVWSNADVRLRVWFHDGTNGFQRLTPDQRLAPQGYLPDGAVTAAKLASGAVDLGGTKITGVLPVANGGAAGANSTLTMLSGLTRPAVPVTAVTANPTGTPDTTELTAPGHGFSAGQAINLVGFNGPGGAGDFSGNWRLNSYPPQTTVSAVGLTANSFCIVEGIVSTAQNIGGTGGATPIGEAYAALRDNPALTISTNGDIYGSKKGVLYVKVANPQVNDLSTGAVFESTDNASPVPNIKRAWLMSTQGYFDVGPAFRVINGDTLGVGVVVMSADYHEIALHGQGVLGLKVGAAGAVSLPALPANGFVKTGGGTGALSVDTTAYQTALTFGTGLTNTAGTIAVNASQPQTTGVGTLTAGATGAGFTVALGTSTITGVLTPQNGGTGLNAIPANGQIPIGNGAGYTLATLTGTPDNLLVTNGLGSITLASRLTSPQPIAISGPAAPVTWTTPAGSFALARTDAAQTFTGPQTFAGATTHGSAGTPVKNLRHGRTAALAAGTRTVADPGCSLGTRYFFTVNTLGTVSFPGTYYVSARAVGTSFTILSNRADDTSILDWMAIEP